MASGEGRVPHGIYGRVLALTILGGLGFWAANFAISLTPVAADYRDALSISYFPMLVEALLGGLVIGLFVSYFLLRFFNRIPTGNPILKSVILSLIALVFLTLLVEIPSKFLETTSDAMHYFLIGTAINVVRILALGVVIGYLYRRWYKGSIQYANTPRSVQSELSSHGGSPRNGSR